MWKKKMKSIKMMWKKIFWWYSLEEVKQRIVNLTIIDVLRIGVLYFVWYYIKQPINREIYGIIAMWILAFFIALIFSLIISKITNQIFDRFFKKLDLAFLDFPLYIIIEFNILDLFGLHILKIYSSVLSTMPTINPLRYGYETKFWQELEKARLEIRTQKRVLEPVISAMDRDRSDDMHSPLVDILKEQQSRLTQVENMLIRELYQSNITVNTYRTNFNLQRPDWETYRILQEHARLDVKKKIRDFLEII
jgi:hypothetical protein